jgi:MFS family permease
MLTIPSLIIACSAPFAGIIIDKGKRKTLLVTSLILYAITGTTGLYLDSIEGFLIARAFLGISVAGIMTSAQTLIADYYYGEERTKALGLQGTFISFGGVLFVAIAGLLATISWRYPFSLYGLALLLAYPAFLYIHEPKQKHKEEIVDNLEHSIYTMHTISIIGICCIVFSGMVIFYCIPTQLPFLLQSYGIDSPAKAGAIVSLATLCGGITSFLMPKLKKIISFARLGSLSFGLLAIGFFGVQITPSYPIILFSALFAGAGIGLLMPSMRLWVITLANPKIRGRSVGFLTSSLYLGQFLSPIIAQPIVSFQSIQSLYLIIAFIAGTLSIILFLKSKKDI